MRPNMKRGTKSEWGSASSISANTILPRKNVLPQIQWQLIHSFKPESSIPTTYCTTRDRYRKQRKTRVGMPPTYCTRTKASEGGLDRIDAQRQQAPSAHLCLRICTSDLCYLMEPRTHLETHGRGIILRNTRWSCTSGYQ